MATATVNSILLSSDEPDALADWYGAVFDATVYRENGPYAVVDLGGFFIMFDKRDDVSGPAADGARIILNIEPDDPAAVAARIDEHGGEWVSPLEDRDGNVFATAKDPAGNWIQLIRLTDRAEAEMSVPTTPYSGFAVRDTAEATAFYRDVLGMRVLDIGMGAVAIRVDGRTTVLAYPKPDHEPAAFTILNIPTVDIEASVAELESKGVAFLRYDGFPQDEKGIMRGNGPDIAWFTDPSGNVLSVISAA